LNKNSIIGHAIANSTKGSNIKFFFLLTENNRSSNH
jgi:hypothetical protein